MEKLYEDHRKEEREGVGEWGREKERREKNT